MKKNVFFLLFMLFISLATFAISNNEDLLGFSYQINSGEKVDAEYESGDYFVIALEPEDVLTIFLPANPTTGYDWVLADELHSRYVTLVSNEYETPKTEMVGAGGTSKWQFKAVNEGIATAALEYLRSWEKDVDPVYTLLLQIQIKKQR